MRAAAEHSRETWDEAAGAVAQAEAIRDRVAPLVELDARRYQEARQLLSDTNGIPADERDARLGKAIAEAAGPPLEIAENAADCAELAGLVAERGDHAIRADALAAATMAAAGAEVALVLLEINLTTNDGDARLTQARELVRRAEAGRRQAADAITC